MISREARGRRGRRMVIAVGLAIALAAGFPATAGAAPADHASPADSYLADFIAPFLGSLFNPNALPPGVNNWNCKLTRQHPEPVLLSNGTFENAEDNWSGLAPVLEKAGYCVFAANFNGPGGLFPAGLETTGSIEQTAADLANFGNEILRRTKATKLDVVGHSQGGMNVRYWIKNLGGDGKIDKLVALAPSNYGTTFNGLLTLIDALPVPLGPLFLGTVCQACNEQTVGSTFLTALNQGGDTVPSVRYTVIETDKDEVVTPYDNAFLAKARNVTNTLVQTICPNDSSEHLGITYDPVAQRLVLNALDPGTTKEPTC